MRTLLERWNNFIRGDRDGVCDSFFPRVARKAKRGPWQRWWTYLRRRHLQLGRTSFPVNSLWPGMQMLDSNAVKPAQKLWTLKMPWLTKLLLTTGSSVNGWPPSLLLFPFLFFLHLEAFGRSSLNQCHPQSLFFHQHSPCSLLFGLFLSLSDSTLSFIQW